MHTLIQGWWLGIDLLYISQGDAGQGYELVSYGYLNLTHKG
jgi:hypothetical protein